MSFYRTILAAVAAAALISPVFADDNASTMQGDNNPAATQQVADASMQSTTEQQTMMTETKINLNKASAKELMKVKGINASKAKAIVAYRKKHGSFSNVDDLLKVKGFKKMKSDNMKEIQDQVSVD